VFQNDIGRPGIASELEAKILAAPKAPGRAEGVPQVADLWRYHRLPQQRADPGARLAAPVIELVLLNCRRWANADKEGGKRPNTRLQSAGRSCGSTSEPDRWVDEAVAAIIEQLS
jgi:hypothetical protein